MERMVIELGHGAVGSGHMETEGEEVNSLWKMKSRNVQRLDRNYEYTEVDERQQRPPGKRRLNSQLKLN